MSGPGAPVLCSAAGWARWKRPVPGRADGSAGVPVRAVGDRAGSRPAAAALRGPSLPDIFPAPTRDPTSLEKVKGADFFSGKLP